MPRLTKAQRIENRILLLEKKKLIAQSKIAVLQSGLKEIDDELSSLTSHPINRT